MTSYLEVRGVVVLRLLKMGLGEDGKGPYSSSNLFFSEISVSVLAFLQPVVTLSSLRSEQQSVSLL